MFLRPLRYKEKSMANKLKESETKAVKTKKIVPKKLYVNRNQNFHVCFSNFLRCS